MACRAQVRRPRRACYVIQQFLPRSPTVLGRRSTVGHRRWTRLLGFESLRPSQTLPWAALSICRTPVLGQTLRMAVNGLPLHRIARAFQRPPGGTRARSESRHISITGAARIVAAGKLLALGMRNRRRAPRPHAQPMAAHGCPPLSAYTGSHFAKGAAAVAAGNRMVGPPSSWSRDQEASIGRLGQWTVRASGVRRPTLRSDSPRQATARIPSRLVPALDSCLPAG